MGNDYKYLVHVSCMTYNHASYIVDAMNGFMMQETTFPFVCTIIDDASTDGEPEVIKAYIQEHLDMEDKSFVRNVETDDYTLTFARHKTNMNCYFAVLYLKYNHYSIKKPKMPYIQEWTNTKYKAICEGDDYWTDSKKLQKQVDFLESHSDYGLVATICRSFVQTEQFFYEAAQQDETELSFEDLLFDKGFATCTALYKKQLSDKYPKVITRKWEMGDYPFWLYVASQSRIYRLGDCTAVYRVLPNSASHNPNPAVSLRFKLSSMDCTNFFVEKYGLDECKVIELHKRGANNLLRRGVSLQYRPFVTEAINYLKKEELKVTPQYYFWKLLLSSNISRKLIWIIMRTRDIIKKDILKNVKR